MKKTTSKTRQPPKRAPRQAERAATAVRNTPLDTARGKRVAVIGTGYVGLVTGTCLAEIGHHVICVDRNPGKVKKLKKGISPIYEPGLEPLIKKNIKAGRLEFTGDLPAAVKTSDIIFIAVNTPPRPDGKADLSHVAYAARQIAEHAESHKVVVDKSTVPVQTGQKVKETLKAYNPHKLDFDVVSNPEFLREGSAVTDSLKPDRIVVGVENERAEQIMRELYRPIRAPFIVTDINSAELIKHASNSFLAAKISFANALADICERVGADVEEVTRGMGLDKRIGPSFLRAGVGYGGSCFPKDVSAFISIAEELGYPFDFLKSVQRINDEARQRFIKRIEEALWVVKGKKIAVWGLAFNPNTDDMRNAPSIPIIEHLVGEEAHVRAYDPVAEEKAKEILGGKIEYAPNAYDAIEGADALLILTEWDEFKKANLKKVHRALRQPLVIDGRNLFDPAEMKRLGFVYRSIGRPR
ncbi:MAG: UDPglucose 6-dehydrogenase [Parcubacteria group bacterium Gr01-1014_106]|nr:MAG: UDPglucose 6-dehydrogenase [Parcubacteria group bacterium Gr01-1014_106]